MGVALPAWFRILLLCRRMQLRGDEITAANISEESGLPPGQAIALLRRMAAKGFLYKCREIFTGRKGRPRSVFRLTHDGMTTRATVYVYGPEDLDG